MTGQFRAVHAELVEDGLKSGGRAASRMGKGTVMPMSAARRPLANCAICTASRRI